MATKRIKRSPAAKPVLVGLLARQKGEIRRLKEKIRRMKYQESQWLRAIAEWKKQTTRVRARLDQIDKLLVEIAGAPAPERKGRSTKGHRARTALGPLGRKTP